VKFEQCGGMTLGQVRCDQLKGHTGSHTRSIPGRRVLSWTDEDTRRELAAYERKGQVF
jgi:hypothetical protein